MPNLYDSSTNKQGLFIFNGEASDDFGIVIAKAPNFEKAIRKSSAVDIPGRNGSVIYQENAWKNVTRSYKVWVATDRAINIPDVINSFTSWLNSVTGYQRLEDSFEPEIFRLAYYNGGTDVTNNLMQYGEATISFTCRPERFYKSGEIETELDNGTIYNPTRFEAKPLIHIEGSGTVNVQIGGNTIVANVTDYINIDCETMNAYRLAAENKNSEISGTFPVIKPGENTVGISGSTTLVTVVPRYFTI